MAKIRLAIWPDFIWSFGQNPFGYLALQGSAHFLPLHPNSVRKSGKDLEIPKKCVIFVRRRKIEMIEWKRLMALLLYIL
jgi:hypothetical protein